MKLKYRRNLPHIQPIGALFFVTFRLAGSIPKSKVIELLRKYDVLKKEVKNINDKQLRIVENYYLKRQQIIEIDSLLENKLFGPTYLSEPGVREIVERELKRFDGVFYKLIAFCIMSNHIHILIDTSIQIGDMEEDEEIAERFVNLDRIMKRIKGSTARYCNILLNRSGQFWERESYDVIIRNEKMYSNVIFYILNNPVKAGMVENWEDYPGNYLINH